jgi:pectinesterase
MRRAALLLSATLAACGGRTARTTAPAAPAERADYVVAADGSTPYRTVQAALDAIPEGEATHRIVLVRNGTYREKVHVTKSHVSIVGEDRERTRIVFAELRRNWRASHPDDWGAAVVNVGPQVTDLTIGNLTVHNDYGGDHDHQFAIRSSGNATRIALLSASFHADGGDTVSLWNSVSGLSYYADCAFSGWVDYVCPRGWAYVTGSRFFGYNLTASIWHDGSKDPDQKLVIRRSSFDGVPGFPLGRHNRDGQIYVLDSVFSERMADRPIYLAGDPASFQWGLRSYYASNRRDGGDYAWFADNLDRAPGAPRPQDVTPAWTFGGRWDPEATLPAVLPFAALPRPESGSARVDAGGVTLRWTPGRNARTQRVHFGPESDPPLRRTQAASTYETGPLRDGATYHWRVDAVTAAGIVRGPGWTFVAGARGAPQRKETRR